MNPELDKKLVEDFPMLYAQRHMSAQETCMCWGFPGDGWEPLIRSLSQVIEQRNRYLARKEKPPVEAAQVKEKFGGLRFYTDFIDDYADGAISLAEALSYITCESCGNPGKVRPTGWVKTMCDSCYEKRNKD